MGKSVRTAEQQRRKKPAPKIADSAAKIKAAISGGALTAQASSKKKNKKDESLKGSFSNIKDDFAGAQDIMDSLGLNKPLERIDTSATAALTDPNSPAFVGKRSQQMQDVIALMQQGLAGLSAPENQALREQAQRSLDTEFQTMARQAELSRARSGVRGAASQAQMEGAEKKRTEGQRNLEQDLLVKNIDIQDQRRGQFANTVSGAEDAENSRLMSAMDLLNKQQNVNLGQGNAERGGNVASLLGITGMGLAKKNAADMYRLARQGKLSGGGGGGGAAPNYQGMIDAYTNILNNNGYDTSGV